MSEYKNLMNMPPVLSVIGNPKEVMIHLISCMCDNKELLKLKKNKDGEFKLDGMGSALSNWQFKCRIYEIEWAADEGEWGKAFELIHTGTSLISNVRSR